MYILILYCHVFKTYYVLVPYVNVFYKINWKKLYFMHLDHTAKRHSK